MQYQELSTVLNECKFANTTTASNLPPNKFRSDGAQLFFEHTKSRAFPFATKAMGHAFWRLTKGGLLTPDSGELKVGSYMLVTCEHLIHEREADHFHFCSCCTADLSPYGQHPLRHVNDTISLPNMSDSKIKTWLTMKRFIEDNQVVIVWGVKVEIQHASTMQLSERGWNAVRGLAGSTRGAAGDFRSAPCISQTCTRSSLDPEPRGAESMTGSLTEKVMSQCYQNMSLPSQKIENMLLDESFANRGANFN